MSSCYRIIDVLGVGVPPTFWSNTQRGFPNSRRTIERHERRPRSRKRMQCNLQQQGRSTTSSTGVRLEVGPMESWSGRGRSVSTTNGGRWIFLNKCRAGGGCRGCVAAQESSLNNFWWDEDGTKTVVTTSKSGNQDLQFR